MDTFSYPDKMFTFTVKMLPLVLVLFVAYLLGIATATPLALEPRNPDGHLQLCRQKDFVHCENTTFIFDKCGVPFTPLIP